MITVFCPGCWDAIGQAAPWEVEQIHQLHLPHCQPARIRQQFGEIVADLSL